MSLFVRESTGLVREVGPFRAFLMSLGYNGFLAIPFVYMPGVFLFGKGAIPYIAIVLSWIIFTPAVALWYMITRQYPRTGADYVYFSRLNPRVGFAAWFNFTLGEMLYDAVLVYFAVTQLDMVLEAMGNPAYKPLSSPIVEFAVSVALLAIIIGVNMASARAGLDLFTAISIVAVASFIASAIYLLTLPRSLIASSLSGYYSEALKYANEAKPTGGLFGLLGMVAFTTAVWAYVNYPATIGGEIRRDRLTTLMGVVGMFIFGGLALTLFVASYLASLTPGFIIGAGYMYANGIDSGSILVNPGALLALINTPMAHVLALTSILWYIAPVTGVVIQVSRYLLAFSMDRVLPEVVSYVHPRTHSPIVAHAIDLAVTIILMAILLLTPFSSAFMYALNLDAVVLLVYTFMASMLLAIPYYARGVTKIRGLGRGPALALSVVYLLVLGIFAYYWLTYPQYYLSISGSAPLILVESSPFFIIGIVAYEAARIIRARQGIPLEAIYAEIPPE